MSSRPKPWYSERDCLVCTRSASSFSVTLSTLSHMLCGWNYDTMPTFNFFRVYLKCFNVLWFDPHNTINPGSLLVNYVLTKNTFKRAATWAIGPGSSGPFGPGSTHEPGPMRLAPGPWPILQRIQILTIQIWKLMALTRKLIIFLT